jgi:hypothetical protein
MSQRRRIEHGRNVWRKNFIERLADRLGCQAAHSSANIKGRRRTGSVKARTVACKVKNGIQTEQMMSQMQYHVS